MLYIVHIVEQKWENLADRHIMCSHLTIFPRQQSFELSGQYHSRWQCQTYYNIRGTGTCLYLHWHYNYKLQAVSSSWKILFYFHHILLSESDGYVLSQPMAHLPTVDRLNRYIIKMIPLCSFIPYVCAYMHLANTYTYILYSCRDQPSELDIPWSDVQRIGSLSWDCSLRELSELQQYYHCCQ